MGSGLEGEEITANINFVSSDCVSRTMLSTGEAGQIEDLRTNTNYNNNNYSHLLSTNCATGTGAKHLTTFNSHENSKRQVPLVSLFYR